MRDDPLSAALGAIKRLSAEGLSTLYLAVEEEYETRILEDLKAALSEQRLLAWSGRKAFRNCKHVLRSAEEIRLLSGDLGKTRYGIAVCGLGLMDPTVALEGPRVPRLDEPKGQWSMRSFEATCKNCLARRTTSANRKQ